jgi:hypothetical protein
MEVFAPGTIWTVRPAIGLYPRALAPSVYVPECRCAKAKVPLASLRAESVGPFPESVTEARAMATPSLERMVPPADASAGSAKAPPARAARRPATAQRHEIDRQGMSLSLNER